MERGAVWRAPRFGAAAIGFVLLLSIGCATPRGARPGAHPPAAPAGAPSVSAAPSSGLEGLWQQYAAAVEAAKLPQPAAISRELVAITSSTAGLRWDAQGRVLMAAWTMGKFYDKAGPGDSYTVSQGLRIWLTAMPFLQDFCRQVPPAELSLRLAQRLGLPPETSYDTFVQMWVDPKDFYRPCPDPEIQDRECVVSLSPNPVDLKKGCPWAKLFDDGQLSERFTEVSWKHLGWMCNNWWTSYRPDPKASYPWTALGYTYDWHNPADPVGESEFVLPGKATVLIESKLSTAEFCTP